MAESRLNYLLQQLNEAELAAFRAHFESSKKRKDQVLGKLLELLLQGVQDAEALYQELYPGKKMSLKQIRNLRSQLLKKLTDFLAVRLFNESPEKGLFIARSLNQMRITDHFQAIVEKYLEAEEGEPLGLERSDVNNRLQAEYLKYQRQIEGRKKGSLADLIGGTEEAFVARMIYYAMVHHSQQSMYSTEPTPPSHRLWPSILAQLENGDWSESLLVQIYYALYNLVVHSEEEQHYLTVKEYLTSYGSRFDRTDAVEMYTAALNYCIRKLNKVDNSYLEEIFHLYQEMLDQSLLVDRDGMSAWHFKSIVTCSVRLKKFEWAQNFMRQYYLFLSHRFRDNLLDYCQGMLDFHQGNFPEAESSMNKVLQNHIDPFFGLDARAYLLRIYYETDNAIGMEALLNSFRLFLRRHKHLASQRLVNFQEFVRFFRRLINLPPDKPQRVQKLKEEILQSEVNAGRDWLMEKLDQYLD